jgi:hypothetical protein
MGTVSTPNDAARAPRGAEPSVPMLDNETAEPLTTSTLAVWPWVKLGLDLGLELRTICDVVAATEGELRDPGVFLTQRQANRVAELLVERAGPAAAMRAAKALERGHFTLAELVLRSAPTARDVIELVGEVYPLVHRGARVSHELRAGTSITRWQCVPGLEVHPVYAELFFAVLLQGIRRETGQDELRASGVWFQHEAPSDCSEHVQMLGPVQFGMPETRFELSCEALELPLLRASPSVHEHALHVAGEVLSAQE